MAFIAGNAARKAPAGSNGYGHPTRSIGGKSEKNIDQRRMKAIGLRTKIPASFFQWSFPER